MTAESDDQTAAVDAPRPRFRRRRAVLLGIALALLAGLTALWLARKPIAADYVDRALAAKGVPVRYHIADLNLGRQRLTDVVIGDPAHPDLVADWIELETAIGFGGAEVRRIRAGHVRARGRLVDGRVSLGSLDRLLPAPSGKPFALPQIAVDVADARLRLETPQGLVGLRVAGSGRLDDGFSGRIAAVAPALEVAGCRIAGASAAMRIAIADARPTLTGPVRAGSVDCGTTHVAQARADMAVTLDAPLDRWRGKAKLALGAVRSAQAQAATLGGSVDFEGSASRTAGTLDLAATDFVVEGITGGRLALAGGYRLDGGFVGFQGNASARRARLSRAMLARVAAIGQGGQGSPVAPLLARLAKAGVAAGRSLSVDAGIDALQSHGQGRIGIAHLAMSSASGAQATLSGGDGIQYGWPGGGLRIDGLLALSGGGLPEAAVRLAQADAAGALTGTAIVRPYAAGPAQIALAPVRFTAGANGTTRFATVVTLSGPLGDGRLDRARMPLEGVWDGAGRIILNRQCAPLTFDRLAISGLVLDRSRLALCPSAGALVTVDGADLRGGVRIAAPRLTGRIGSTPIALAASGSELRLGDRGFTLDDVAARIGSPDRVTRIEAARLEGRIEGAAVAGHFAGAAGQIGNVPLLMSEAAGDWRFANGTLSLTGGLTLADAAEDPRFKPLRSQDFALTLAGNRIDAGGMLVNPETGTKVTDVVIAHDLATGAGHADLAVPGIRFTKGFQPDRLTRLTFGVIADVEGIVSGEGHIAWTGEGVTSTGVFRTAGTDLAAAFGPVTGLSTEVRFTDLLNLVTAPDQVATIASVNPGIAATDGVIRYRTLSSTQVQVEGGRWPFAGGELVLDPTLLDFAEHHDKQLTFRVTGMDAAQFLQQFDFKNLDASGTFDGVLPMVFDETGGRIENGHLTVREGGGTIAYVGEVSQKDLGFWGNMAFEALKSLRYRDLAITMNGPLSGEMVTEVRFAGIKQGQGTKSNFLIRRLTKLPFIFNVRIKAPFRGLIDSARSFYDPARLVERNLPALLRAQDANAAAPPAIQPPESETVP